MKNIFLLFLFTTSVIVAQGALGKVSSFVINERLDYRDPVDLKLGRYEAYEINIGRGDNFAVELKSEDFWPVLLLMSPSKKSILKFPVSGENIVRFDTTISESGTWELYVIGDTNTVGSYSCEVGFADSAAMSWEIKDDCSAVKYFVNHANANFIFLRTGQAVAPDFIDDLNFSEGKVEFQLLNKKNKTFNELSSELKSCLGDKWIADEEISDANKEYFVENVFKNRRTVVLENLNGKIKIVVEKE